MMDARDIEGAACLFVDARRNGTRLDRACAATVFNEAG